MRRWIPITLTIAVLGAVAFTLLWQYDAAAPRFVRFTKPPHIIAADSVHFDFLSPNPFRGRKMWVGFRSTTNSSTYRSVLLEIDQRRIAGELLNASAVALTPNESKLLCVRRTAPTNSFRETLTRIAERLSGKRIKFARPPPLRDDEEQFWLLDLKRNSAKSIGTLTQPKGIGSTFIPSPDRWSGYKVSFSRTGGLSQVTFLFNLRSGEMERLTSPDWPVGWWDDGHIIFQKQNRDLFLLDVSTKGTKPLLLRAEAQEFLRKHNIDAELDQLGIISRWNRRAHELHLTESVKEHSGEEPSFIARLEGEPPRLTLVAREFEFERLGDVDDTRSFYVFSPREVGQCCNGVALRELKSGKQRVLVPASSELPFGRPRFYRDTVIYARSNSLWQVDLTGSNNVRLFPPLSDRATTP